MTVTVADGERPRGHYGRARPSQHSSFSLEGGRACERRARAIRLAYLRVVLAAVEQQLAHAAGAAGVAGVAGVASRFSGRSCSRGDGGRDERREERAKGSATWMVRTFMYM